MHRANDIRNESNHRVSRHSRVFTLRHTKFLQHRLHRNINKNSVASIRVTMRGIVLLAGAKIIAVPWKKSGTHTATYVITRGDVKRHVASVYIYTKECIEAPMHKGGEEFVIVRITTSTREILSRAAPYISRYFFPFFFPASAGRHAISPLPRLVRPRIIAQL